MYLVQTYTSFGSFKVFFNGKSFLQFHNLVPQVKSDIHSFFSSFEHLYEASLINRLELPCLMIYFTYIRTIKYLLHCLNFPVTENQSDSHVTNPNMNSFKKHNKITIWYAASDNWRSLTSSVESKIQILTSRIVGNFRQASLSKPTH